MTHTLSSFWSLRSSSLADAFMGLVSANAITTQVIRFIASLPRQGQVDYCPAGATRNKIIPPFGLPRLSELPPVLTALSTRQPSAFIPPRPDRGGLLACWNFLRGSLDLTPALSCSKARSTTEPSRAGIDSTTGDRVQRENCEEACGNPSLRASGVQGLLVRRLPRPAGE